MDFSKLKDNKILIALLIIALVIRIIFIFSLPVRWWDETIYANFGHDLSKNIGDYSFRDKGWSDYMPSIDFSYAWPKAGFRAPLLSYTFMIFYFLRLDFVILYFMPIIGTLTIFFVYVLCKKMFNKNIALYSSIILTFIPLHVIYSSKMLTDSFCTFFVILSLLSLYMGYEEKEYSVETKPSFFRNKNLYKILFGLFLALALLSRYTILWIFPAFLIYFLIRFRLSFLKDKYFYYSILVFFIVLAPFFIYSYLEYGNILGAFIHGLKASSYWGGIQNWDYYFRYFPEFFSLAGVIFLFSFIYIFVKKEFVKKEIYLFLILVIFFLSMAILVGHKEDRFILPIVPALVILAGFFIDKIPKYYKTGILILIVVFMSYTLVMSFTGTINKSYTTNNICFLKGNLFLKDQAGNFTIISDEPPIVYYYTHHKTSYYPNPFSSLGIKRTAKYQDKSNKTYILFSEYDMPLTDEKNIKIKDDLDLSFKRVYDCENSTFVYEYIV